MNKSELINAMAEKSGCSKADVQSNLNALQDVIKEELKKGGTVALTGFGTFKVSDRKARTGRNPQTGAEIKIAACKVAQFKPGKILKTEIQ